MIVEAPGVEPMRRSTREDGFEIASRLAAEPDVLWRHAVGPRGVNREFRPILRMTFPRDVHDLTAGWQPGRRRFRSWLLFLGVVPVEYDDLTFERVEPGRAFLERSRMLTQRVWEHERTIDAVPGGCVVRDRIRFEPRWRALALLRRPVLRPVFRAVFRWRHRNLRKLFGELR